MQKQLKKTLYGLVLISFFAVASCASKDKITFSEENWGHSVEKTRTQDLYAPNHQNGRYFAPWMKMEDKSFLLMTLNRLFERNPYSDEEKKFLPKILPDTAERLNQTNGDFILWIGHNTFLLRIGDQYYLTDPIFTKRALLPKRLTPPAIKAVQVNTLAKDRLNIIISHNHYDHLDRNSMENLTPSARVFVPMGLERYVKRMRKENVHEMNWWETVELGQGIRLICLPAQHWSMRVTQGRNRSLWASWLLITPRVKIYFGGDSGYFKGFREIGKKFPDIDYAFMATTAYEPRWFMHYSHMNIPEAVKGFEELNTRFFIPTQWGTFHLGAEPAGFPGLDLKRYIQDHNLDPNRFKIMDIGQIIPIETR